MNLHTLVQELARIRSQEPDIVSVFLNTSGHERSPVRVAEAAHQLARRARLLPPYVDGSSAIRDSAERSLAELVRFIGVDLGRKRPQGFALFLRAGEQLAARALNRPIAEAIALDVQPHIAPLLLYKSHNPDFAAVLVDREKARLFLAQDGNFEELEPIHHDVPGRIAPASHYGLADKRIERHVDEHIQKHLKHVSDVFAELVSGLPGFQAVVGGPPDVVPAFLRELETGAGTTHITRIRGLTIISAPAEIAEAARGAAREAYLAPYRDPAADLQPADASAVLDGLHRGALHDLAIEETAVETGAACTACGMFWVSALHCPACGSEKSRFVTSLVNTIALQAIRTNCDIAVLPSGTLPSRFAGIRATFRFVPAPEPEATLR